MLTTSHKAGRGFVNQLINKLPVELHIPGYNYCGPGTKLNKRLTRGDLGVNKLDEACKQHDIAYDQSKDLKDRHLADSVLIKEALHRLKSKDAKFGEKLAAAGVASIIKSKLKFGMGIKRKRNTKNIKTGSPNKVGTKRKRNNKNIKNGSHNNVNTRTIKVPKRGGILPLLAGLAGLISAGVGISKAISDKRVSQATLEELKRHNLALENKSGKGLKFARKPKRVQREQKTRKGKGLYLRPYNPKNL